MVNSKQDWGQYQPSDLYEGRIIHYREQAGLILRILVASVGVLITGVVSLVPELSGFDLSPFFLEVVSQLQGLDYIGLEFAQLISTVLVVALFAFSIQFLRYGRNSIRSAYSTIHPDGVTETVQGEPSALEQDSSNRDEISEQPVISSERSHREFQETKRHFRECLESLKSAVDYGVAVAGTVVPVALNQPETTVFVAFPMILVMTAIVVAKRVPLLKVYEYVAPSPAVDASFLLLATGSVYASINQGKSSLVAQALLWAVLIISFSGIGWTLNRVDSVARRFLVKREALRFGVAYVLLAGILFVGGGEPGEGSLSTFPTAAAVSSFFILLMMLIWPIPSHIRQSIGR